MDEDWQEGLSGLSRESQAMWQDVAALRAELRGPLLDDAERAGDLIERRLARAIVAGKLGFEDLKRMALSVMNEVARGAVQSGLGSIFGALGGGGAGGLAGAALSLLGLPGRAAGGPVAAGRAYMVGERGPEMFVPTAAGRVEAAGGGARSLNITVNVQGAAGADPQRLAQSGRQLAQAVRRAVMQGDG